MRRTLPDVMILRHGETEWNLEGRMQGAHDSPLTQTGRAQAADQGTILRRHGVDGMRWVSSPQGRAKSTAHIAKGDLLVDVATDSRLSEITLGDWSGRLRSEIADDVPHLFESQDSLVWYDHAPGGEGLAGLVARTAAFLDELEQPTVIVTHGITSRILRCQIMDLDIEKFDQLPGGQGNVYKMSHGMQFCLTLGVEP